MHFGWNLGERWIYDLSRACKIWQKANENDPTTMHDLCQRWDLRGDRSQKATLQQASCAVLWVEKVSIPKGPYITHCWSNYLGIILNFNAFLIVNTKGRSRRNAKQRYDSFFKGQTLKYLTKSNSHLNCRLTQFLPSFFNFFNWILFLSS